MPAIRLRDTAISYLASALLHAAVCVGLSWTFTLRQPEYAVDSQAASGEITAIFSTLKTSSSEPVEAVVVSAAPEATRGPVSDPVEQLLAGEQRSPEEQRVSHTATARQRMPRSLTAAGLVVPDDVSEAMERVTPRQLLVAELPPICEQLWKQTSELPKQIDFDALAKLLEKAAAHTPAVTEGESETASAAMTQGTRAIAPPRPGPRNPPPAYPVSARKAGQAGVVLLTVTVTANGTVSAIRVGKSSGFTALDEAALTAVRNWTFEPARQNGVPVDLEIDVPIRFRLSP